jgi:hypothetical protein
MNNLFEWLPSGEISISPELLMIKEFEKIWSRDNSKNKLKAKKELTFVWGMCATSDKNIWSDFKDELERAKIIKSDIFEPNAVWKPDELVLTAIDKYKERIPKSPLDKMLESVEGAIGKLSLYLDSVDFTATDENGRLIHDPKKVRDIISTMGKTVGDYNELKRQIAAGKQDSDEAIRGGGQKGMFEDADSFKDLI